MDNEMLMLQRHQMKKANFERVGKNDLLSPFHFIEFGLSSKLIPDNMLCVQSRENEVTKPNSLLQLNNHENVDNTNFPQFIHPLHCNLRNYDFSNSFFLNQPSKGNDNMLKATKLHDTNTNTITTKNQKFSNHEQWPNTATLTSKKYGTLSEGGIDHSIYRIMKPNHMMPTTAAIQQRYSNESLTAIVEAETSKQSEIKSSTTKSLIYCTPETLLPHEQIKTMSPVTRKYNNDAKKISSPSLLLKMTNDLDVNNIVQLKEISKVEICDSKNKKISPLMEGNIEKVTANIDASKQLKKSELKNNSFDKGSKCVAFNKKGETQDVVNESQSDVERCYSSEDSDESSNVEDESQGSIVSTDSEDEDDDSKGSLANTPIHDSPCPTNLPTKTPFEDVDSDNTSKENNSGSSENGGQESLSPDHTPTTKKDLKPSKTSTLDIAATGKSLSKLNTTSSLSKSGKTSKSTVKSYDTKGRSKFILNQEGLLAMKVFKETQLHMPLIFSKFPFVTPVINFVGEGEKIEQLPWQLRKLLRWRTSPLTPVIVKQTITRSGFKPSRLTGVSDDLESLESNDWILYFGKHIKGPIFKTIKNYQQVNHFPGSFQLGRKDRLWRNICKKQLEIGKKEYDFIPETFCLPVDLELFRQCWDNGGVNYTWIIKPPASARGIGIKVVSKWNQIPKRRSIVVQKYISNPYLINASKFDLRLYVFLASIDPLRIYLYDDGLVRFASIRYTNSTKTLHNRFIHLTNYSINKLNVEYLNNNDNEACKGHKWSLKSLWSYLRKRGINTDNIWDRIKDLVVKTIISAEDMIFSSMKDYCSSSYNAKELFGFDVLLDENLKPWILEVNVSPSLHSDSPLDVAVKGAMIKDALNLSGFMLPEADDIDPPTNNFPNLSKDKRNKQTSDLHIDPRFWIYTRSEDEMEKSQHFEAEATNWQPGQRFNSNDTLPYQILDSLTPGDVRCLVECYDEYERKGHFQRIYPVPSTELVKKYLSYFERIRYSDLLLATFITKYHRNKQDLNLLARLCQRKLHLISSERGDKIDSKYIWHNISR